MNSFNWRLICNVSDTLELSAARFRPFSNTLRCKFPSPRCPNPVTEIVCFCREGDFEAGCVPDVAGSALTSIKSSVGIAWRIKLAVSVTSWRSEEHTSELQSLMRISYAVFCLKKKKEKHHY